MVPRLLEQIIPRQLARYRLLPGETIKTIAIPTVEDTVTESRESFSVNLAVVSGDIELENTSIIMTIDDDDIAPSFSMIDTPVEVVAGAVAYFEVVRSSDNENSYTVDYATTAGTAVVGIDYVETTGTLTFAPGELLKRIEVPTSRLGGSGGDFTVTISNPSNGAAIEVSSTTGMVRPISTLAIGTANIAVGAASGDVYKVNAGHPVTITLAAGSGGDSHHGRSGGNGGIGTFSFTPVRDIYLRARVGKAGMTNAAHTSTLADITGGGSGGRNAEGGQGGGASSIVMSVDGVTWQPVAVLGAGGGASRAQNGGHGGGFNLDGVNGASGGYGGRGATTSAFGAGGYNGISYIGGDGGSAGEDGKIGSANLHIGLPGQGDVTFGIGGGGAPTEGGSYAAGGGGAGYYGGGGGAYYHGAGGGGSGFFDAAAIEAITGGVPTIVSTQTGGNDGDGSASVQLDIIPAAVQITASNAVAEEGQSMTFTLTATGTSPDPVEISYSTSDGTAIAGADYTAVNGTVTFAPGEIEKTITVNTLVDSDNEGDETLNLALAIDSGDAALTSHNAVGTIWAPTQLAIGTLNFDAGSNNRDVYKINAGHPVTLTLAAGSGGDSHHGRSGGNGGTGTFSFTPVRDIYLRARVGRAGADNASYQTVLADITGGGVGGRPSSGGQGGGATSLVISSDGLNWTPVAIVGGGGGASTSANSGHGGGLHLNAENGQGSQSGKGATIGAVGVGGYHNSAFVGGDGGAPGEAGTVAGASSNQRGQVGQGDGTFGIGGGGAGNETSNAAGGGGSGYYGGGASGVRQNGAGGGSGFFDAAAIEAITGGVPTIVSTQTGGNDGDGSASVQLDVIPAAVQITASNAVAEEGQSMTFTLTATGTSPEPVEVSYSTSDGTAIAGADYATVNGTVIFSPGETEKTILVSTLDDAETSEGNEAVVLSLSISAGDARIVSVSVSGTIVDNDGPPVTDLGVGTTILGPDTDSSEIYRISANQSVSFTIAGGQGGDGRAYGGARGGKGTFHLTAANDFYLRTRIARLGLGPVPTSTPQNDINGGGSGSSNAGQGGGGSSLLMSSDGVTWQVVAIAGGGGAGGYWVGGGQGGGLNQSGGPGGNYSGGTGGGGGTLNGPGVSMFGQGGVSGAAATGANDSSFFGQGNVEFSLGGGGAGASNGSHQAGGGGGGYHGGGGGGSYGTGGGGGSGFFDASAIETITGGAPTITSNQTGGNDGDGSLTITISNS